MIESRLPVAQSEKHEHRRARACETSGTRPTLTFMTAQASLIVVVLPELFQLLAINGLLLYAMAVQAQNTSDAGRTPPIASWARDNAGGTAHEARPLATARFSPVLQSEPIVKLAILGLGCSALLYANTCPQVYAYGLIWDDLGRFMSVGLALSALSALSLSVQSNHRFGRYEFVLITWLSLLGMFCLIKSYSFLALYLSIELQSLSFYMLAAMRSRNEASAEAGLKYFILSAFASAMLLFGMALTYGTLGSTDFADVALYTAAGSELGFPGGTLNLALGTIAISLLFKLGAAPFHAWIADVYEGSHSCVTAWFALTSKFAILTGLIRLSGLTNLNSLLLTAAGLSLVVGSLSAARQVKLKRLLAFSAVANAGWFLLALGVGLWQLSVIHLLVYTLLSLTLFGVVLTPLARTHPGLAYRTRLLKLSVPKEVAADHGADGGAIKYISDLVQIHRSNPYLALGLALSMFSLAGVPPLAGFYSKYLILDGLTQNEAYPMLALSLAVAVLSAFYYLRLVKVGYFGRTAALKSGQSGSGDYGTFSLKPGVWTAYVCSLSCVLGSCWFLKPAYFCSHLALI